MSEVCSVGSLRYSSHCKNGVFGVFSVGGMIDLRLIVSSRDANVTHREGLVGEIGQHRGTRRSARFVTAYLCRRADSGLDAVYSQPIEDSPDRPKPNDWIADFAFRAEKNAGQHPPTTKWNPQPGATNAVQIARFPTTK